MVYDNWLGDQGDGRSVSPNKFTMNLLPSKNRFQLVVKKDWKKDSTHEENSYSNEQRRGSAKGVREHTKTKTQTDGNASQSERENNKTS